MNVKHDFFCALAISGAALGLEIASGRAIAMFYGQMAGAGWLGVILSALLFGAAVAWIQKYRGGCLPQRQSLLISILYGVFLLCALCMLLKEAWHIGQLVLPLHRAGLYAALIALLLAAAAALSGERTRRIPGCIFMCMLAAGLIALLLFGRMEGTRRYALQLRLGNSLPAALLLSLAHTAVGIGLAAGMVPRKDTNRHPVRLGVLSALLYGAALALGKGIFIRHEPILLQLRSPFAALAAGWGKAGFGLICLLIFLGCMAGLSAILSAVIPKRKNRNFGENRC